MYLFIFSYSIAGLFFDLIKFNKVKFYFIAMLGIFFSISFTLAFKYNVIDYFSYERIYENTHSDGEWIGLQYYADANTPIEPGFAFLIILDKIILSNFYFFIGAFSFAAFSIKFYLIKKLSPYLFVSLFLYICNLSFFDDLERVRSAMAGSLTLLAIYFLSKNERLKSFFLFLSAISFHFIAALGLIIIFYRFFCKKTILLLTLLLSIFIAALGGSGKLIISTFFSAVRISFDERLVTHIDGIYGVENSLFSGTYLYLIANAFIYLIFFNKIIENNKCNLILTSVYVIYLSLSLFFIDFGIVSSRIWQTYCLITMLIVFPSLLKSIKDSHLRILFFIPFFIINSILFFLYSSQRDDYQSILQII